MAKTNNNRIIGSVLPFKEMKMEVEANERNEIKRNNFVALGVTEHAIVSRAHTAHTQPMSHSNEDFETKRHKKPNSQ